jgi:Uma2 family endonuclease
VAGGDRFDEVWNGVYVMSPIANNEHQNLVSEIVAFCRTLVDWQGLGKTFAGANVTDRSDGWQENYRVPDVLVFSRDTSAIDLQTHWLGGPDLAIEIVSDGDRTYEKLDFCLVSRICGFVLAPEGCQADDRVRWKWFPRP